MYISLGPKSIGGGANTFASNFHSWIKNSESNWKLTKNIVKADVAIIIAHKGEKYNLENARANGCFIIHRLDEYVEALEDKESERKHEKIRQLNKLVDVTVYQSEFVFNNMHRYLNGPQDYSIILNGGDAKMFYPSNNEGTWIGHVTWGIGAKKRLDLLHDTILKYPSERFLLVGNQTKSKYQFKSMSNVTCVGPIKRKKLLPYLQRMKCLYFPSEKDPCPNTVVEALLAGVPVCYNKIGGTKELVKNCGVELEKFDDLRSNLELYRSRTLVRMDLAFERVAQRYLKLYPR